PVRPAASSVSATIDTDAGFWPRSRAIAPSARARPAPRKMLKPCLVEVAELIVQPRFELGVGRAFARDDRLRVLDVAATRPFHGDGTDQHQAACAEKVRYRPRQPVEAAIDRLGERFLAAVFREVVVGAFLLVG